MSELKPRPFCDSKMIEKAGQASFIICMSILLIVGLYGLTITAITMNRLCAVVGQLGKGDSIVFTNNRNGKFTTEMLFDAIDSEFNKLQYKSSNNIIIKKLEKKR